MPATRTTPTSDITSAEPMRYEIPISRRPPTKGTNDLCFLP